MGVQLTVEDSHIGLAAHQKGFCLKDKTYMKTMDLSLLWFWYESWDLLQRVWRGGVFTPRHVIIHELLCDQPLNVRHALYIVLKQLHILYLFPFSRVCVRVHCVFTPEKLVSQDFWGQGSSFRCSQKNTPSSAASGGDLCAKELFSTWLPRQSDIVVSDRALPLTVWETYQD